jgi:TP901 family phage tail tape measure protein
VNTLDIQLNLTANLSNFRSQLEGATGTLRSAADKMRGVGTQLTLGVTAPIVGIGTAATVAAERLNRDLANITSLGVASEEVTGFKDDLQAMAVEMGRSTTDLSSGMYDVVSAFGNVENKMDILRINATAAAAGLATTQDALALTSAVTRSYGDTSTEAVQKASDLAFMAVNLGQVTFPELAASMGKIVPLTSSLGASQEELFAVMASATGVTGGAAEVSTQMRQTMQALMAPTKGMRGLMAELGYSTGQAMLADLGYIGVLEKVREKSDATNTPLQKFISGIEGQTLALALTGPLHDTYVERLEIMNNAAGSTAAAFEAQTQGINKAGFAMQQARARMQVFLEKLGDALAPTIVSVTEAMTPFVEALIRLADWFNNLSPAIKNTVIAIGAIAAAVGPVLIGLSMGMSGLATAMSGIGAIAGGIGVVIGGLSAPILAVVAAVAALGVAYSTNFLGIRDIVNDFAASVVAAFTRITSQWDRVTRLGEDLYYAIAWMFSGEGANIDWWYDITGALEKLLGLDDNTLYDLGTALFDIGVNVSNFVTGFKDALDLLGSIGRDTWDAIAWIFTGEGANIDWWGDITAGLEDLFNLDTGALDGLANALFDIGANVSSFGTAFQRSLGLLGSIGRDTWDAIAWIFTGEGANIDWWGDITAGLEDLFNLDTGALDGLATTLFDIGANISNFITNLVTGWGSLTALFTTTDFGAILGELGAALFEINVDEWGGATDNIEAFVTALTGSEDTARAVADALYAGRDAFNAFRTGIDNAVASAVDFGSRVGAAFSTLSESDAWAAAVSGVSGAVGGIWTNVQGAFSGTISLDQAAANIGTELGKIGTAVTTFLASPELAAFGANLLAAFGLDGVAASITEKVTAVTAAVGTLATSTTWTTTRDAVAVSAGSIWTAITGAFSGTISLDQAVTTISTELGKITGAISTFLTSPDLTAFGNNLLTALGLDGVATLLSTKIGELTTTVSTEFGKIGGAVSGWLASPEVTAFANSVLTTLGLETLQTDLKTKTDEIAAVFSAWATNIVNVFQGKTLDTTALTTALTNLSTTFTGSDTAVTTFNTNFGAALTGIQTAVDTFLGYIAEPLQRLQDTFFASLGQLGGLGDDVAGLGTSFTELGTAFGGLFDALGLGAGGEGGGLDWMTILDGVAIGTVAGMINTLNAALGGLVVFATFAIAQLKTTIEGITGLLTGFTQIIEGIKTGDWSQVFVGLQTVWESFKTFVTDTVTNITTAVSGMTDQLVGILTNTLTDLGFEDMALKVQGFVDSIKGFFEYVSGLATGAITVEFAQPDWVQTLTDWATAIPNWITSLTGFKWPDMPDALKTLLEWAWPSLPGAIETLLNWDWPEFEVPGWVTDLLNWRPPNPFGWFGGQQLGTSYYHGGPTLVGEAGAEVLIPPRGSEIVPHQKARRMLGDVTINVYGATMNSQADIEVLARRTIELIERGW